MLKYSLMIIIFSSALSGCFSKKISCSSKESVKILTSIVEENFSEIIKLQSSDINLLTLSGIIYSLSLSNAIGTIKGINTDSETTYSKIISSIQFDFSDITLNDNSVKNDTLFCGANTNIKYDLRWMRKELEKENSIFQSLEIYNKAQVSTFRIKYTIQRTEDNGNLYIRIVNID